MLNLLIIFILLFAFLLTTSILILFVKHLWHINQKFHVGYLPSSLSVVGEKLKEIIPKYYPKGLEKVYLVEPGAGFAHVARYLSEEYKFKGVIAIEDELSLYWIGKLIQKIRKTGIEFIRRDVIKYQNPKNSLVYSYLLPEIITEMYNLGRLDGCLVISLTFAIQGVEPKEIIKLENFQERFLIYDFRK